MQFRISLFIITVTTLVSVGLAQNPAAPPQDANAAGLPSFPYVAEITADDVLIRSGPGTNYYPCGRLKKGDKLEVVSTQFSWSRIAPPAGSFSWISTRYVSPDSANPHIGVVTGDNVRVYVGSPYRELIHSTTLDLKLNKGDKIHLTGEQKDDYYKIGPPSGAYRWVSTKYTQHASTPREVKPRAPAPPPPPPPAARTEETAVAVTPHVSVETDSLKQYHALEKQIQTERAKPIAQQDYTNIKQALLKLAANKEAGKAARYAQFAIKQVARFELAPDVAKTVRLQDAQLQQIQSSIERARTTRLSEVQNLGRFAVVGQLQTSNIYIAQPGPKHYRITDDSGKTLCYAVPTGPVSGMDLTPFTGQEVGLVGAIEPHLQTEGAIVKFTEIVRLK